MTATVTINGSTYALSELSSTAKDMLRKVEAAQNRIDQLKQDLSMITIARQAYAKGLMEHLPPPKTAPVTVN